MTLQRKAAIRGLAAILLCLGAACGGPAPRPGVPAGDKLVLQASSSARMAYETGDYAQARTQYRLALTRAQAINDAGQSADAAFNLALSEIGLQNYEAADQLLQQAEYDAKREASDTGDIRLLRAKVAYLLERLAEADALANEIIAGNASPHQQLQARILRTQILCDNGDLPSAQSALRSIDAFIASAESGITSSVRADAAKLHGTIARMEGNNEAAARFSDAEVELLRTAHRYRDMGNALARTGDAYLAAGQAALAADRFFLAARSLAGLGDAQTARIFAQASLSAAAKAGDDVAHARARMLLEQMAKGDAP